MKQFNKMFALETSLKNLTGHRGLWGNLHNSRDENRRSLRLAVLKKQGDKSEATYF
jgi:hypothetical protein